MNKILIMKRFLIKLINLNIWGGRHTELKNLKKSIPKHLRGEKIVDKAIKELIKKEFITAKRSTGEIHISLNSQKQQEIYEFVKRNDKFLQEIQKSKMKELWDNKKDEDWEKF